MFIDALFPPGRWLVGRSRSFVDFHAMFVCLMYVLFLNLFSQVFCKGKIITNKDSDSTTAAEEVSARH